MPDYEDYPGKPGEDWFELRTDSKGSVTGHVGKVYDPWKMSPNDLKRTGVTYGNEKLSKAIANQKGND